MLIVGILTSVFAAAVFLAAWHFSKNDQFYSDTHMLIPAGIFVWGDGLVLAPFWILSGLIFTQLTFQLTSQYMLLFWAIRSGYEVVYWLTHQAAGKNYEPPLFRNVTWLDAQQAAILYQLITTLGLFLSLFGLLYSFTV